MANSEIVLSAAERDELDRRRDVDFAGRVTTVSEESGRLLKSFVYDTISGAAGKLAEAHSFNYAPTLQTSTIEVDETYAYDGIAGAVSDRTTQFVDNGTPTESFTLHYDFDRAGQVKAIDYPGCTGGSCGSGAPSRTVDYSYTNGFLTSVPGFASSITYHPNGLYSQIQHADGLRVQQAIDTGTMMQRPLSFSTYAAAGGLIDSSGTYAYDGAGNIKGITPGPLLPL